MPRDEPVAPSSLLEDAIDIPLWLRDDRATPYDVRCERDRALGLALPGLDPVSRVRGWWRRVAPGARGEGARLARLRALVTFVLAVLGTALGGGVALGALGYEGQHPVNVVTALALLVLLPLVLLVVSLLLLLPGHLPGLGTLQRTVAAVSVGSLASALAARFAPSLPEGLASLAFSGARRGPAARVTRWQLLLWSQVTGLGFSAGALAASLGLVVFTDLAFGWSTTLELSASGAKGIVDAVAAPWSGWLPAAVPDSALIEESRFYRLERAPAPVVPASRLTGWWPFLLAALVAYGAVPRALVLLLARVRLRVATRDLLLSEPEVRALLDRMERPDVRSAGTGGPAVRAPGAPAPAAVPYPHPAPGGGWVALVWDGALSREVRGGWVSTHLGPGVRCADVGGGHSLEADLEVVSGLDAGPEARVAVLTKAWEPPLGDFRDFLARLRERLGPEASIMVVPVGLEAGPASGQELEMWRQGVAPLGDRAVYVEGLGR